MRMAVDGLGAGEPMQVAVTGGEIVECGKGFQVAVVTAKQNLAQVDEAADRLLEGGDFVGFVMIPMFHLAVVSEEGNVMGRGVGVFMAEDGQASGLQPHERSAALRPAESDSCGRRRPGRHW